MNLLYAWYSSCLTFSSNAHLQRNAPECGISVMPLTELNLVCIAPSETPQTGVKVCMPYGNSSSMMSWSRHNREGNSISGSELFSFNPGQKTNVRNQR